MVMNSGNKVVENFFIGINNINMSLQIDLQTPLKIVKQPLVEETSTEIVIERIIDIPQEKKEFVVIKGDRLVLIGLSGDKHDNPEEWTNSDIIEAVKAHYNIS